MHDFAMETIAYQRLVKFREVSVEKNNLIKFPNYFSKVCSTFCLTKQQAWDLAKSMQEKGLIEIVPFHGVRLNRLEPN